MGKHHRLKIVTVVRVEWLVSVLATAMVLAACAHGGEVVYPAPDTGVAVPPATIGPSSPTPRADTESGIPTPELPVPAVGGTAIVPDPSDLEITNEPNVHHAVDLVSSRSVVITANSGGWPVVIHNNDGLLGSDGCNGVALAPEGDTRLTLILPKPGIETRSRFYLVGCGAGEATLEIVSEGEQLATYRFQVGGPG